MKTEGVDGTGTFERRDFVPSSKICKVLMEGNKLNEAENPLEDPGGGQGRGKLADDTHNYPMMDLAKLLCRERENKKLCTELKPECRPHDPAESSHSILQSARSQD